MKFSLRLKWFAALVSLVLFFILLSWILNSFFLEKFYLYKKNNSLIENFRMINRILNRDPEEISLALERMERFKGIHIIILDKNFETVYNSMEHARTLRIRRSNGIPAIDAQNLPENLVKSRIEQLDSGKVIIENRKDNRLNSNFIRLFSKLDSGEYVFLSTSVAAIEENADISNTFFLITGLITLILGSFIIIFITGKFTKPILHLKEIAQRMSSLDFSKRYLVTSSDEVGQLGASINSLSEQLEKSIYELKAANEKLKQDIEFERKNDEMRKEFISSVSHELKTPIALIQGYAEGLKLNVVEDEENKNFYCDVITDEALKMNKLVKQLLELSQLQSGNFQLEKEDFNISALIDRIIKKNSLLFRNKNINVAFKDAEINVYADSEKIEQVLCNYINNAVNHVENSGTIKVEVSDSGNKARVSVFNSGRNIPQECIEDIWKSFYKIDKSRTRSYGGTGLGLSIVRAIQEAHNNRYGVNNLADGVEFWFELDKSV